MKYFFDCANILEVKMYNNTLPTNKTKELIFMSHCISKKKKFETNAVFRDAYALCSGNDNAKAQECRDTVGA